MLFNAKFSNLSVISWREQVNFHWDDDETRFVLDQHAELDFYSAGSLKQQPADRHVAPLGHIILIPSQPVFALSPQCCVLSGEATNANFIVFGFTRPGLEPTIYPFEASTLTITLPTRLKVLSKKIWETNTWEEGVTTLIWLCWYCLKILGEIAKCCTCGDDHNL